MLHNVDRIYVINLKRNHQRLDSFKNDAKRNGIVDVEIIDGYDYKMLEMDDNLRRLIRNIDCPGKGGVIGCALSHFHIWKKIASFGQNVIIFEDDVVFKNIGIFKDSWNKISEFIPNDAGIVYLNHILNGTITRIANPYFTNKFHGCMTACAYYITSEMAQIYVDLIIEKGILRAIDGVMLDYFESDHHTYPQKLYAYIMMEPLCHNFLNKFKSEVNNNHLILPPVYHKQLNVVCDESRSNVFLLNFIKRKMRIDVIKENVDTSKDHLRIVNNGSGSSISPNTTYFITKYMENAYNTNDVLHDIDVPLWYTIIDWFDSFDHNLVPFDWLKRDLVCKVRNNFCVATDSIKQTYPEFYEIVDKISHIDAVDQYNNSVASICKTHNFALVIDSVQLTYAFAMGCIPIYIGNSDLVCDFNKESYINCNGKTHLEIEEIIRFINNDMIAYLQVRNQPVFSDKNICYKYEKNILEKLQGIIY
jgi:GR25 family glycosyltransferase involved in LPS biosynthesis